jgi:hypothetical protein
LCGPCDAQYAALLAGRLAEPPKPLSVSVRLLIIASGGLYRPSEAARIRRIEKAVLAEFLAEPALAFASDV